MSSNLTSHGGSGDGSGVLDCVARTLRGVGWQSSLEQHKASSCPSADECGPGTSSIPWVLRLDLLQVESYLLIFLLSVFQAVLLSQLVVEP